MSTIKDFLRKLFPESFILWTHKVRGVAASIWYGFPSRKLKVIGVTGTNGKTTVCNLIAAIFTEAGYKVGLATTINFRIGTKEWKNNSKVTSMSPFGLQKLLREMVKEKCQYAILETSSHSIMQYRNWGIRYEVSVFTNLTHDHLDYHKSMTDYREQKIKMFANNPSASVINRDDPSYIYFAKQKSKDIYLYGIDDKADVVARKIMMEPKGSLFALVVPNNQISIDLKLPGKFNIYNALAAASAALSQNISLTVIKKALESVKGIPGRLEKIECGQDFEVLVDYAHTPDGLQKVFETVKQFANGKIIHVGGATGRRDKTKRPLLGALAGKFADIIIVTDEDPYDEDPREIIEQVAAGVPRGVEDKNKLKPDENFFKILDRKEAIEKALSMAKKNDIVLITGKGCEEVMAVGDKLVPYSDKKVVEKLLAYPRISQSGATDFTDKK